MKTNKTKLILATLSLSIIMVGISTALPSQTAPQPASASQDDKYDGDCTGQETVGRCADKCPPGSYQTDTDPTTGAAVCKTEPTGCPYGDSIPADSPKCEPPQPATPAAHTPATPQTAPVTPGCKVK